MPAGPGRQAWLFAHSIRTSFSLRRRTCRSVATGDALGIGQQRQVDFAEGIRLFHRDAVALDEFQHAEEQADEPAAIEQHVQRRAVPTAAPVPRAFPAERRGCVPCERAGASDRR